MDGNNRLQAMKELGFGSISCLCIAYKDIFLTQQCAFKKNNTVTRLSEFAIPTASVLNLKNTRTKILFGAVKTNSKIPNGETWHKPPYYITNLPNSVD